MRAAALAALALAGCASLGPAAPLANSEWRVAAINGRATPPPPASYRMRFEERTLGGQFGCNHFGGNYRLSGDLLTTGAMMMTEMACSEPADSFEAAGIAVLRQPARISWQSPDGLMVTNDAGSIELIRR